MKTLFALCLLFAPIVASAQDEPRRIFAIDGQIGGAMSDNIRITHPGGQAMPEKLGNGNGMLSKLRIEYYLPRTPLSVKAGYEQEEYNFFKTNVGDDMDIISLGMRCYPGRKTWLVQPYVGLDGLYNYSAGSRSFSREERSPRFGTLRLEGMVHTPHFSLAPIAGVDLYLLGSIALQFEYGYRVGFGHSSVFRAHYGHISQPFELRLRPVRHSFNVGLKVVFPFHFNPDDGGKMMEGLLDLILGNSVEKDRRNQYR